MNLLWLAGLLEGEGSFMRGSPSSQNQPRISIQMTDEDVIARVATLWGTSYLRSTRNHQQNPKWKVCFQAAIRGANAVALMNRLRPFMGQRRQTQIDAALATYVARKPGDNTRRLTGEWITEIRLRHAAGETYLALSKEFNVSRITLRHACTRRTWKSIP